MNSDKKFQALSKMHRGIVIAKEKGYYIDEDGLVYNADGQQRKVLLKNVRKPFYYYFHIRGYEPRKFNITYKVEAHKLQAYQKFGDLLFRPGIQVCHINNDSLDNSWDNITIGTIKENRERISSYRESSDTKRKLRYYSDELVAKVRARRNEGKKYKEIMEEFDISSLGSVHYILNNEYKVGYSA